MPNPARSHREVRKDGLVVMERGHDWMEELEARWGEDEGKEAVVEEDEEKEAEVEVKMTQSSATMCTATLRATVIVELNANDHC